MHIAVIGGTGYAGSGIVREAASRAHQVTAFSRSIPSEQVESVTYIQGSALSASDLATAVKGCEVIIASLSPRGELQGKIGTVYKQLVELANEADARLMIVGGFGTLRPAADKPRFIDDATFPKEYFGEAKELADIFTWLSQKAPISLDWLYMSPAGDFGGDNRGTARKAYRTSGEIALYDEQGNSDISGADFALAVIDEVDHPTKHRTIISFAY